MTNWTRRRAPIPRGPPYRYRRVRSPSVVGASLRARRRVAFGIRHSDFVIHFTLSHSHWRESRDWFADSRELSRCDHLIDVFVSCAGFLSEARP